jgi:hypothetical protein
MNIGMLWFDNDPKTEFTSKVERAAAYYRNKYGRQPTLCFVHPCMIGSTPASNGEQTSLKTAGVEVRSTRSVLPNHFWIGVNGINVP